MTRRMGANRVEIMQVGVAPGVGSAGLQVGQYLLNHYVGVTAGTGRLD